MAREVTDIPPVQRGGGTRKSVWSKYADGKLWELNVYDDLAYPQPGAEYVDDLDVHARKCQAKAMNAARQWASNHDHHVLVRRQGMDKVVVRFTHDPDGKLRS